MIYGDYHTHTVFSHGKGSVLENAQAAAEKGLKEIAITDHGFGHIAYNVRRKDLPYLVRDKLLAGEKHPGVNVMLGIEANILDARGTLDLRQDEMQVLDIIVCGYHKYTRPTTFGQIFAFSLPVLMSGLLHKSSAKRTVANTDAYIKAIERYPIDIISHPGFGIQIDFRQLARAAAHFGTLLELNGKRISFDRADAEAMLEEGARFIVNSDAHSPSRVGDFEKPLRFAEDNGIPMDCIANWGKKPVFRGGGKAKI